MSFEENRGTISNASPVRKGKGITELIHSKTWRLKEGGVILCIANCISSITNDLPVCEDGVKLSNVEEVDRIICCTEAAHGPSNEALHINPDEQVKETMERLKVCTWQCEDILIDDIPAWEALIPVLSLQTPSASFWGNAVLTNSEGPSGHAVVLSTRGITKSISISPHSSCIRSHREWCPIVKWDGEATIEVPEKILKFEHVVSVEHKELAL